MSTLAMATSLLEERPQEALDHLKRAIRLGWKDEGCIRQSWGGPLEARPHDGGGSGLREGAEVRSAESTS